VPPVDESDIPPHIFISVGSRLERGQPSTHLNLQARHRVVGSMPPPDPGFPIAVQSGHSGGRRPHTGPLGFRTLIPQACVAHAGADFWTALLSLSGWRRSVRSRCP
jgi:hypothetical protein